MAEQSQSLSARVQELAPLMEKSVKVTLRSRDPVEGLLVGADRSGIALEIGGKEEKFVWGAIVGKVVSANPDADAAARDATQKKGKP